MAKIIPVAAPEYDVCLWPIDPACKTEEWNALNEADQRRALALASSTLRRLTGYRVGGCPVTIRPCRRSCAAEYGALWRPGVSGAGWTPHINLEGKWVNACGCSSDCSCGPLCEITIPGPVGELISVQVGTEDITDQVIVQGDRIVYIGTGDCPFPTCQDMTAAPGTEGAFAVTYLNSYPVDGMGAYAAGILAMEFAKACTGRKCSLPPGTTNVTRQGVSIEVVTGSFPGGVTGIREVDAYIALWRPEGSPQWEPRVWTPRSGTRVTR